CATENPLYFDSGYYTGGGYFAYW
nr:immunoglobulin heavy chain junction region [Macaca mulatta]MOY21166.1 immunoglobulin heavy chain junction region [Macaca mulatta]MOY21325.1 immunoglobulin heavy chain junction region [Macaca mulatta]MOY21475.1 immunoglobulin heavy chain junction region [Macaca mulatta]MOY21689.1 immunoglobulin heavy chain junction region [Macaca mulatta]